MPPLIALAAAGVGLYVAGRFIRREMARAACLIEEADKAPKPIEIRLEKDPADGIWREPKGPGEI